METFSAVLALYAGHLPVTGEFPTQRPVMRSFDVFFDLRLNKRLSKQSWGWLIETPSRLLWRHFNDINASFTWTCMAKNLGPLSLSNKTFRKASRPRDLYSELNDRSEIWPAQWQQCCRYVCRISKLCNNFNYHSRGFDTSRHLPIRRLTGYWNGDAGDLLTREVRSSAAMLWTHSLFQYQKG